MLSGRLSRDARSRRELAGEDASGPAGETPALRLRDRFFPSVLRARIVPMETPKQQVEQILATLPESASLEDIQYHIYVRQKIEQGMQDVEAGRVVSQAEVEHQLAKWRTT
jgi:hypothetical protein